MMFIIGLELLYKTNPKLTLVMTLALFSLAGIPPFAGFFSKIFIFVTAFSAGFKIPVFVALINTIVSLYYYLFGGQSYLYYPE